MSTPERDLIVGGQAVIEGVMMRTPNAYAIAVRKADGTIVNTAARLPKWSDKFPLLKLPVLRGGAVLVQSMGLGIKALNYSAGEAFVEAEEAKEVEIALTPAVIEGEGDFAGVPFPVRQRGRRVGDGRQALAQAKPREDLHGVGPHLNAGADAAELWRLLVDRHVDADPPQACSDGQTTDAGADYGDGSGTPRRPIRGVRHQAFSISYFELSEPLVKAR